MLSEVNAYSAMKVGQESGRFCLELGSVGGRDGPADQLVDCEVADGAVVGVRTLPKSASSASRRKRISSSSLGAFWSIHCTAFSYHERAASVSPRRWWAMARKKKSKLSPPPRSFTDLSRSATAPV